MNFRWIDGISASDEEWSKIDELLAIRGWASLARATSRILVAEEGGKLAGFIVFQMVPYVGPEYVSPSQRGTGLAKTLADKMQEFLTSTNARCYIGTAESEHARKIFEDHGMVRLDTPVYMMGNPGAVGD